MKRSRIIAQRPQTQICPPNRVHPTTRSSAGLQRSRNDRSAAAFIAAAPSSSRPSAHNWTSTIAIPRPSCGPKSRMKSSIASSASVCELLIQDTITGPVPLMNAPEVSRIASSDLTVQRLLEDYVALNRPVVVTGALGPWDIDERWTPTSIDRLLGDCRVHVYNNYFDLQSIVTLLMVAEIRQYSAQKIRQLGLQHAATQGGLRTAGLAQAAEQCAPEVIDILGPAIGQRKLGGMPGGFDGVELGSVGGQVLQVKSRIFAQQNAQGLAVVDRGVVPHDDHVTAQMSEQVPQEIVDLLLRDVVGMHTKVQAETTSLRAHRQSADHRDPIATVVVANNGCLPDRRSGAPYGRNHHEAGFVGKDEMGTQPRSVFFTCGHRLRFHSSIFCSSHPSARRSGFWQLKPRSCSRRAT